MLIFVFVILTKKKRKKEVNNNFPDFFFFFFFFAYDLGSLCIAFQGGNNMAYHVGLGQAAYDVLMNSLAWVCHVTQAYLSSY